MKIYKKYQLFIVFLIFGFAFYLPTAFVKAESVNQGDDNQVKVNNDEPDVEDNDEADVDDNDEADVDDNDEADVEDNDEGEIEDNDEAGIEDSDKVAGEQHRSRVANVVQKLIKIADKDNRIETEVKVVAQEEKDASEKVKDKMDEVEDRGGFKTFLIGSDYKNLGALRSELVTTENHLDRLNRSLEKTTDDSVKAELEVQINELTNIKAEASAFAKNMEGKFSLFGWLVRMFQ